MVKQLAQSVVDLFKEQPIALTILGLSNLGLLVLIYVIIRSAETRQQFYADQHKELVALLAKCVP